MKAATLAFPFLLLAGTALAADAPESTPDYSREHLMVMFRDIADRPDPFVYLEVGEIRLRTPAGKVHFNYLPFLAPLQGSYPRISQEWPDPFVLTNTPIAMRPHREP
jgi:hypothetical protein